MKRTVASRDIDWTLCHWVFNLCDLMTIILFYSNEGDKLCKNTLSLRLVNSLFYQRTNQLIKEATVFYQEYQLLYSLPNISILSIDGPHDKYLKNDDSRAMQRALFAIPEEMSLTLHLKHLTTLNITGNHYAATEEIIQSVASNLKSFAVRHNKLITDNVGSMMINLESLCIGHHCGITNTTLKCLTQLKELSINSYDSSISDEGLTGLSRLETLTLSCNEYITDKGLGVLKNLKHLILSFNDTITDQCLSQLTNLKTLTLICDWKVTVDGIRSIPDLEKVIFDQYTNKDLVRPIEEAFPSKIHYI